MFLILQSLVNCIFHFADGKDPKKQGYCSSSGLAEGKHIKLICLIIKWHMKKEKRSSMLIMCVLFWIFLVVVVNYRRQWDVLFLFQIRRKCLFQSTEILTWSYMSWLKWILDSCYRDCIWKCIWFMMILFALHFILEIVGISLIAHSALHIQLTYLYWFLKWFIYNFGGMLLIYLCP